MANAMASALRDEITKRDNAHANLTDMDAMLHIVDEMIHGVLKSLEPMHTEEEDCNCEDRKHPNK